MRILADFHHLSLFNSLVMLFERRLGHEVHRPIGMEWFREGYWAINDQDSTARQYLETGYTPTDGTPPLNGFPEVDEDGWVWVDNPEDFSEAHSAVTLEWFKANRFDVLIASIPEHIAPFRELIRLYQPHAKLIVQVGNAWDLDLSAESNLLCSSDRRTVRNFDACHSIEYHQEFDTDLFSPDIAAPAEQISSFTNVIQEYPAAWSDFLALEREVPQVRWRSYGGQCRDGCLSLQGVAQAMADSALVFHVKPGGDGYGHIVHNAYARGRMIITRKRDYFGSMAERLMVPGTYVDLDAFPDNRAAGDAISALLSREDDRAAGGWQAAERFAQVVSFTDEAERISEWMEDLR